jgi:cobalt-zinc-cadmium efflux system outer membrane protein
MKKTHYLSSVRVALFATGVAFIACLVAADTDGPQGLTAADEIVASIHDVKLRLLAEDILERNPRIARMEAETAAVEQRAPQVEALPNPTATLTWFVMSPQTRVGPQRAAVNLMQRLPWFGTLKLDEQAALWDAVASKARLEAARIDVVTKARTDYHEIQFLDLESLVVEEDRATLAHYAELALARYASGVGLDQAVIKIQAEITRTETRLLEISARRAAVEARLNAMRDRPQATPIEVSSRRPSQQFELEPSLLRNRALESRPEIAAADALVEAAAARIERSKKAYSPNVVVGLNYGFVSPRDDEAGRLNPPEGNGQDILGLTGGISLPLWRSSLKAGVEEGVQNRLAAEEGRREVTAVIDGELGDLVNRIPLLEEQVSLYNGVLIIQAGQSLRSAESAYAAGTVNALDLLDAERVLLQVRIAEARVRTGLDVAVAKLEGVIAGPLTHVHEEVGE